MEEGRTNPLRTFQHMANEWNRMRYLGTHGYDFGVEDRPTWSPASAWVPNADIFARGEDLVVRVQLAGVGREEVEVTLRDDVMTISGERKGNPDEEGAEAYVRELFYGTFRRDVSLPPGTDGSKIEAVFNNGMVEITVRGAAADREREPQRIEVKERSA